MAGYEALKAKVQELAERDWNVPAIEARMKRLSQDGIPRKKLDPKEMLANKEQVLDRVQRRAEEYNLRVTRQESGHVFGRIAYNSADDEQWLALDGVRLIPIRKKNMQPHAWADEYDLGLYRKRIESVNSQLESMGVEHLKARECRPRNQAARFARRSDLHQCRSQLICRSIYTSRGFYSIPPVPARYRSTQVVSDLSSISDRF